MSVSSFVFIHGGPGVQSFAEEDVLTPYFEKLGRKLHCWNEPALSSDRPYEAWAMSAEEFVRQVVEKDGAPVHLIAHSFGNNALRWIAARKPGLLRAITLVSPNFEPLAAWRNACAIAIRDFEATEPQKSRTIAELLAHSPGDTSRLLQAFGIAMTDPLLLTHYFDKVENLQRYASYMGRPGGEMKLEAMTAISLDLDSVFDPEQSPKIGVPTQIIFGAGEVVSPMAINSKMAQAIFQAPEIVAFETRSHFLHFEEPQKFVDQVLQLDSAVATGELPGERVERVAVYTDKI